MHELYLTRLPLELQVAIINKLPMADAVNLLHSAYELKQAVIFTWLGNKKLNESMKILLRQIYNLLSRSATTRIFCSASRQCDRELLECLLRNQPHSFNPANIVHCHTCSIIRLAERLMDFEGPTMLRNTSIPHWTLLCTFENQVFWLSVHKLRKHKIVDVLHLFFGASLDIHARGIKLKKWKRKFKTELLQSKKLMRIICGTTNVGVLQLTAFDGTKWLTTSIVKTTGVM